MASKELRGASRRAFLQGATAIGAALGWGPTKLLDFMERGGGTAAADCSTHGVQNLVVFVGAGGSHGYPQMLFPHPDSFTAQGRYLKSNPTGGDSGCSLACQFMQNTNNGGSPMGNINVTNTVNFNNMPLDQRFQRYYGVDNMAFGGFKSVDPNSIAHDTSYWQPKGYAAGRVPTNAEMAPGDKFILMTPHTPWLKKYGLKKAITAIDGGAMTPFHVSGANGHQVDVNSNRSVLASAATIQLTRPSITPVIIVGGPVDKNGISMYGTLAGAPVPAAVGGPSAMVDLFNSNATLAAGTLSNPANAVLYEAYVKGLFGSSKTATVPTFASGYRTGKLAANLIGVNLADKLRPTDFDRQRYGFTGSQPVKVADLRDSMIVAAKALKLGLTSQVVIQYFNDDPHGAFTAGGDGFWNAADTAAVMSTFLNAFMDDLMAEDAYDPFCPALKLGDNTVIAFLGDTPRTMILRDNWNDPTNGGQNRTWIMSNGLLKTGFFGGDRSTNAGAGGATNDHNAAGPGEGCLWDFKTGDAIPFDFSQGITGGGAGTGTIGKTLTLHKQCGEAAMAAILYAVSRGDIRRVNDFYSGPEFPAVQVPVII